MSAAATVTDTLRQAILSGRYPAGSRLPGERKLAVEYDVARMTLKSALDQLRAEGLIVTRPGSGSFVAEAIAGQPIQTEPPNLSAWGERISHAASPRSDLRPDRGKSQAHIEVDFNIGRTFSDLFPYDVWRRLLNRYLSTDDAILARYGSPAGFAPLRQVIADIVARQRGVYCSAEQVIIVNGIQQALDLLSRLLIDAGDEIVVETPGYVSAYRVFDAYGAKLKPLPTDADGLVTDKLPADARAKLSFVTPSNQFPRGGALPLERRLALLNWTHRQNGFIIEDDYDGELFYEAHPPAALHGLDPERVIYLGTFSKVLFPALRLGYVVLPRSLHTPFLRAKALLDRGAPTLTQAAVADFIAEGHFERHLKRLRQLYGSLRKILVDEINAEWEDQVRFNDFPAGLHLYLEFKGIPASKETEIIHTAAEHGIAIYPSRVYQLKPSAQAGILLGFSGFSEVDLKSGIGRLTRLLP